jgi:hypothetical protein
MARCTSLFCAPSSFTASLSSSGKHCRDGGGGQQQGAAGTQFLSKAPVAHAARSVLHKLEARTYGSQHNAEPQDADVKQLRAAEDAGGTSCLPAAVAAMVNLQVCIYAAAVLLLTTMCVCWATHGMAPPLACDLQRTWLPCCVGARSPALPTAGTVTAPPAQLPATLAACSSTSAVAAAVCTVQHIACRLLLLR